MEVEALLNTMAKTLAEAKVKTIGDRIGNVHCEALVDTSADILA